MNVLLAMRTNYASVRGTCSAGGAIALPLEEAARLVQQRCATPADDKAAAALALHAGHQANAAQTSEQAAGDDRGDAAEQPSADVDQASSEEAGGEVDPTDDEASMESGSAGRKGRRRK